MKEEREFFLKKKIAVLYGGWSSEREVSINSGQCVLTSLRQQGFTAYGIDVDRNFTRRLRGMDVAFIALHGKPGEDGTVQGILEFLGIPYTGSGVLGSSIGMDKIITKQLFEIHGVATPPYCHGTHMSTATALQKLGLPIVIKPRAEGSSVGVTIAPSRREAEKAVKATRAKYGEVFFEKYIPGMMATCGILAGVPLPVLEIAPKKRKFYDYKSKYTEGMTEYIVPARIPRRKYKRLQDHALTAHHAIGAHGFSRVDFVLDKNHNPFALEVNTIPGLLMESNLPLEARAMGLTYDDLTFEILKTSLDRF
jgi:D-alanine-D-alanine ligase